MFVCLFAFCEGYFWILNVSFTGCQTLLCMHEDKRTLRVFPKSCFPVPEVLFLGHVSKAWKALFANGRSGMLNGCEDIFFY